MDTLTPPQSPVPAPAPVLQGQTTVMPPVHHSGMPKALVALIIVAVLVGGYTAAAKYANLWPFATPTPSASPTPSPTVSPTPSPTATANATAGWKVYANATVGVQFMMPATWASIVSGNEITISDSATTYGSGPDAYHPAITITARPDTFGGSIVNYEKTLNPAIPPLRQATTEIIDERISYVYRGATGGAAQDFRVVFANGKIFLISSNAPLIQAREGQVKAEVLNATFKTFLTAFKFSGAADVSTWRTFTSATYSYTVKYPPNYVPRAFSDGLPGVIFTEDIGMDGAEAPFFMVHIVSSSLSPMQWFDSAEGKKLRGDDVYTQRSTKVIAGRSVLQAFPGELGLVFRIFSEGGKLVVITGIKGVTDPVPDVIASFGFTK